MLAVSGLTVCGLVPLVTGSLIAMFSRPLAKIITEKDGVEHKIRRVGLDNSHVTSCFRFEEIAIYDGHERH